MVEEAGAVEEAVGAPGLQLPSEMGFSQSKGSLKQQNGHLG